MRLVILNHDSFSPDQVSQYFISGLIPHWEKQGIQVFNISGTRNLPDADVAFLHVDLSRLPKRFTEAVRRYPVVLNSRLQDICKRSLPDKGHHVLSSKEYGGAVLLKTDMNHKAEPERRALRRAAKTGLPWRERWELWKIGKYRKDHMAYKIYDASSLVPRAVWKNRHFVVERFLPEREGNNYVLRNAYFLNGTSECWKVVSPHPIVRWRELIYEELCDMPPEIETCRKQIGMDYGKIDFVMHEGRPFIFDINKTIGGPALPDSEMSVRIAQGLLPLFKSGPCQ